MEEKVHEQSHAQPHEPAHDPVPKPPKHKLKLSKWLIILIAVLAVIVVIIAGSAAFYFLGKTPNTKIAKSTANPDSIRTSWKTYTNTKFNFTVDYPGDWSFNEYSESKNGASFNPINKPGSPDTNAAVTISAGQKTGGYADYTLEEYAKIAATAEIQNYNKLATIKKVTTANGAVGYETTWMVQPITVMGRPPTGGDSESLPITYFEIPGNKTTLVRVTLDRKEDLETYEKMLTTVKISAPLTPIPTVDEAAVLKYVIKKYIALKHNSKEDTLTVTVSKIEGNYAQGGVSDEGGGGMWFAARVDDSWLLVWDGNGVIECSIFTLYPSFPTSMIPECYDEATQNTIKR